MNSFERELVRLGALRRELKTKSANQIFEEVMREPISDRRLGRLSRPDYSKGRAVLKLVVVKPPTHVEGTGLKPKSPPLSMMREVIEQSTRTVVEDAIGDSKTDKRWPMPARDGSHVQAVEREQGRNQP